MEGISRGSRGKLAKLGQNVEGSGNKRKLVR